MDIKSILNESLFGILLEGIGFLFVIGMIAAVIMGGGLGAYARLFATALCG